MVVETRSPGRTREIEKQEFADSCRKLQESGVVEWATDIANSHSGVELELRNKFKEEWPGLAPGMVLKGLIPEESRVELEISMPLSSSRTLRIAGRIRTAAGEIDRNSEWGAELPIGSRNPIRGLIEAGVKWARFAPADKAKEFTAKFDNPQ